MPICIYCRRESTARFPREHVIPKAFGRFKNNLTLRCVCGQCNTDFGKALELFLTRDSVEALLRIRYGLKTKSRLKVGRGALVVRVTVPGDWCGARLSVWRDETDGSMKSEPLPQVAFRKNGETEWEWFLENELEKVERWQRFRIDAETKIFGQPDAVVERIFENLAQGGLVFKKKGEFEKHGGDVPVYADRTLDDIIFRAVAKIAFNFLAYIEGVDFALRADFDPIRDYIRLGTKPPLVPVIVTNIPILLGDDRLYRQTNGHGIILDWNRGMTGIVCQVSLFNHLTYHVALCPNYSGVLFPISAGRHFDLNARTISEVQSTHLVINGPNVRSVL